MLHADHPSVRALLLKGNFGLEKESLRVDEEGFLSHTSHPFPNDAHIVRDFCENQTESNTPVTHSAAEAVQALIQYDRQIQKTLKYLPNREYLWPFSNPPYVHTNHADSLYYSQREEALLFATTPLDGGDWKAHPFTTLCAYRDGQQVFAGTNHGRQYRDNAEDMHMIFADYASL